MRISYPSSSRLTLSIDSFEGGINTSKDKSLTGLSYATSIENFSFIDGALKNGIGFEPLAETLSGDEIFASDLKSLGSIERVFHFYKYNQEKNQREDKLILVNNLCKVYYINLFDENKTINSLRTIAFTTLPVAARYRLNGDDVIILTSETDNMVVWDGTNEPYTVLDSPKISSMAIHYERLFATIDGEKSSVWFSDDLDPTNWSLSLDEAGFIEMIDERGALLKVVSFLDYIYIFREFGISRLTAYGDQSTFAVSNLFVSSSKIYASSVCVCGDRILFLAEDGLYSFDGVSTRKILKNIENNLCGVDNKNSSATFYSGNYYLACKFKFINHEDECKTLFYNNALLVIDASELKLINITHGVNLKYLSTIEAAGGVIALATDDEKNAFLPYKICKNAQFNAKNLEKVWISPTTNLSGGEFKKVLKTINILTKGKVSIYLYIDKVPHKIDLNGSDKPQTKRLSFPLNNFSFKIVSTDEVCDIKNLNFTFSSSRAHF